tara:strand:- start:578 stop:799 length:222 start_codon:yes stop_codon:yes gene_type:complete
MPTIKQKAGKPMPEINPENADLLWHALFAITHAVEQLQLSVDVNTFRNEDLDIGAWEFARIALQTSRNDIPAN